MTQGRQPSTGRPGARATTPMMAQYREIKARYPDAILFFRLGDFYEMFDEDALEASRVLELTLTARESKHERVPMCGVPHHAAETYIARLLRHGYRVAICEQVEDPRQAKGIVRREVVKVITPGTVMDGQMLAAERNNYVAALVALEQGGRVTDIGLAYSDVSTGTFAITQVPAGDTATMAAELARLQPAECLVEPRVAQAWPEATALLEKDLGCHWREREASWGPGDAAAQLAHHFGDPAITPLQDQGAAMAAGALLLQYLRETQFDALQHVTACRYENLGSEMLLDPATRRHLELTEGALDGRRQGTLLSVLDTTKTAMGSRLLRHWIQRPLLDRARIEERLDLVGALVDDPLRRHEIRELLRDVYDLERLAARAAHGSAGPRDLANLRRSLEQVPALRELLLDHPVLEGLGRSLDPVEEAAQLLQAALVDEPAAAPGEGTVIRPGFDAELDRLRQAAADGKGWIARLESLERERTGIKSLKVGYNKVFGYYLEVTNPNRHLVPDHYERRQTLANAERYVTPELKAMEEQVLGAADRLLAVEQSLFRRVRQEVGGYITRLQGTAAALARLDVLASLAEAAVRHRYVRPELTDDTTLYIEAGRHPVLEQTLPGAFVPNDIDLDGRERRTILLTGPNMAGKSTYLRQTALLVLMAQMGSFVPAKAARIGLVDRIFCRVGAADDLARGYSTFMVEVTEALQALRHGTGKSLAIVDELGRGTSTYDGIAIATAYLEYLHNVVGCRTLASTHYFELTELADRLPGFCNYHVGARPTGEGLTFLYHVRPGPADRSYGVEVARMAGMPAPLIQRAREILRRLEGEGSAPSAGAGRRAGDEADARPQTGLELNAHHQAAAALAAEEAARYRSAVEELLERLAAADILQMTPLEAMALLDQLAQEARRLRE